ncbi:MAG: triose-phosphate isomerase [Verrucomicrobiales bacterium]
MRRPIIAANWKMNKTSAEAQAFLSEFLPKISGQTASEVVIAPAFPSLFTVGQHLANSSVLLAAQNMHAAESGAYTGEISATMLIDAQVDYVILGHSERRSLFHETDEIINAKVHAALKAGLKPILCIGETLKERDAGKVEAILESQLKGSLAGLDAAGAKDLVIAYEPVWAIGTGRTASPEQAQEAHAFVRKVLTELFGSVGDTLRIQYGGSVKPGNAKELLGQPDIDGALVGGASLVAEDFAQIVSAAS